MARLTGGRSAKSIVDDALGDNRFWEWLCYAIVVLLVLTGLTTLVVGVAQQKEIVALTGGGVAGLFWPAMHFAKGFRSDNIRIRMYEYALSKAETPAEAAAILKEALGALRSPTKARQMEATAP